MKRSVARALLGALGLLIAGADGAAAQEALAPSGSTDGVFERGVVEVEPGAAPIGSVVIDNRLGDVRVEGYDGKTVIIDALKRAPDDDTLERLKVSLVPDPSGAVRITTRVSTDPELRRIAAGTIRIDLVVRAPRGAAVEAMVWNGSLVVSGVDNGAQLTANEGDISVSDASGRIVTSSAMGTQRLREIVGEVDARGLYGELALEVVRGRRLAAAMHEGRIVAHKIRSNDVTIHVIRGDVSLTGVPPLRGHWSVVTYHGNIELAMTERAPVRVSARARRGTVDLPAPLHPAREDGSGWIRGHNGEAQAAGNIELAANVGNIGVVF